MKTNILIFVLCLFIFQVKAQSDIIYTYTPDSTSLSIIFGKGFKFDNSLTSIKINLQDKWKIKSSKIINVQIDMTVVSFKKSQKITFIYKLFGKEYMATVVDGEYFFSKKIPLANFNKNPKIELKVLNLKNQKDLDVWINSIGVTTLLK